MQIESKTKMNVFAAGVTIFAANVCVMMLELSAGRIASRQFGTSLYTWTSIIGVTLAGITIGNYIGGRLADRFQSKRVIGVLLAACSASCVCAIILKNLIADRAILWQFSPAEKILAYITLLLLTPSALIGAVSPIAVKIALEAGRDKGRVVGRMYALGAAGSILGTFITGYWFIAAVGAVNTIWVVAAVMLLGAFIYLPRSVPSFAYIVLIAFFITSATVKAQWAQRFGSSIALRIPPDPTLIYEKESQYCYIGVRQASIMPDERYFIEDNLPNHSRLIMGKIRDLRLFYTQAFGEITQRAAKGKEKVAALVIGGGGYVFPRYILDYWPLSRVDVVEIDPEVTKAAKLAFGLSPDTPINTFTLDGRNYIDELLEKTRRGETTPRYDLVYMDAFNDMSVPFQLVTRQFNEKVSSVMADDGFYIINMIDLFESAKFLASIVNTVKLTFPYVYVVPKPSREELPCNFIIAAGKRPLDLNNLDNLAYMSPFKARTFDSNDFTSLQQKRGWFILDDDFAPVENLLSPVVRRKSRHAAAQRYIEQADMLYTSKQWQKALGKYNRAIRICPALTGEIYRLIASVYEQTGQFAESAASLRSALSNVKPGADKKNTANIHYKLAEALNNLGHPQEASTHYTTAIELLKAQIADMGNSAETFWEIGQVESAKGDMKEATKYFEMALAEEPDNINYHLAVANVLADQKQYDSAIRQLDLSIQYMQNARRNLDAEDLKKMRDRLEIENRKQ